MTRREFMAIDLNTQMEFIITEEEISEALCEHGRYIVEDLVKNKNVRESINRALVSYSMASMVVGNLGEVEITQLKHDAEGARFRIVAKPNNEEKW